MTFFNDPHVTHNLLSAELERRGYTTAKQYQNGKLFVTFTSPSGGVWHSSAAQIHYPFTSGEARKLADNKLSAYAFARAKQVPIPFTRQFSYDEQLNELELTDITNNHAPLIVKPNDSSLSKGLTMNIDNVDTLKEAVRTARLVKESDVLVQHQVTGEEIRFILVKGKVIAALLRETPHVVGDGVKTVETLIAEENKLREALVFPYISYPPLNEEIIDAAYLHDQRILKEGETLELSKATMIRNGCSVYDIFSSVHPSYIEEAEMLVRDVDTSFLVADFLIDDYRMPGDQSNHSFLEFNISPVLKLCYGCRDGKMVDIVPIIADLIDEVIN